MPQSKAEPGDTFPVSLSQREPVELPESATVVGPDVAKVIRDSANTIDSVVLSITNALRDEKIAFENALTVSIQLERLKETAQTLYGELR